MGSGAGKRVVPRTRAFLHSRVWKTTLRQDDESMPTVLRRGEGWGQVIIRKIQFAFLGLGHWVSRKAVESFVWLLWDPQEQHVVETQGCLLCQ